MWLEFPSRQVAKDFSGLKISFLFFADNLVLLPSSGHQASDWTIASPQQGKSKSRSQPNLSSVQKKKRAVRKWMPENVNWTEATM